MHVHNILKEKGSIVHTIDAGARISDAITALNRHNIGALVALDQNGNIAGILSERDIIRHLGADPAATMNLSVADCMTPRPATCHLDTSVAELMERMTSLRVRHIPVMDGRKLVGIISIGDVVKAKIEEIEHDAEALREYIAS